MKKYVIGLVMAILVFAAVASGSVSAGAPYCGISWGSLPKTSSGTWDPLTNIRTGRHDCYDRIVFDTRSSAVGYTVRYVTNVSSEGEGRIIPLNGGAKLQITIQAPSYDPNTGTTTYPGVVGQALPSVNLKGYQTFRDAKFAGSFEGYTSVGLGVRARLPFRVFQMDNHLVVDVAHYW
jgi:hypothetical protein